MGEQAGLWDLGIVLFTGGWEFLMCSGGGEGKMVMMAWEEQLQLGESQPGGLAMKKPLG